MINKLRPLNGYGVKPIKEISVDGKWRNETRVKNVNILSHFFFFLSLLIFVYDLSSYGVKTINRVYSLLVRSVSIV